MAYFIIKYNGVYTEPAADPRVSFTLSVAEKLTVQQRKLDNSHTIR